MLKIIDNPRRDPRFTSFNLKIEAYNHAKETNNLAEARQLLQEIHYFQQELTNLALDSLFDPRSVPGNLKAIFDWNGVSEELMYLTKTDKMPVSPLSIEVLLNTLTGISETSKVIQQWREDVGPTLVGSVINAVSFLWGSGRNPQIDHYITELLTLHDTHGFASLNYFYGLQQIKAELLHNINFTTLPPTELVQYQSLLNQINGQISEVIQAVPVLASRYAEHESIALSLRQDFQTASPDNKEKFFKIFMGADFNMPIDAISESEMSAEEIEEHNEAMATNRATIHELLPNLEDVYVRKISSANNKTWLLQNDEIAEQTVLRVEQPNPATLIQRLRITPVNDFLSQNYATCLSENNGYPIVFSEFSKVGDLRSNRKSRQETQTSEEVRQHAISDVGQMAQFCRAMIEQQAMHSDLKLSNFLLSDKRKMFANDMKAFQTINADGNILARNAIVTPPFAPPEYKKSLLTRHMSDGKPIELNADKFMSYQLGLALYDHLVLPKSPDWSEQALDFNHPVFDGATGKKLQTLIKVLTLENPDTRLGTRYALEQLEKLQGQSVKLHMTLQVSEQPPSTSQLAPTDLDLEEDEHSTTVPGPKKEIQNEGSGVDDDDPSQTPKI